MRKVKIRIAVAIAKDGQYATCEGDDSTADGGPINQARTWLIEAGGFPVDSFWLETEILITQPADARTISVIPTEVDAR